MNSMIMAYLYVLMFCCFFSLLSKGQNYYDVFYESREMQTDLPFNLKTEVKSIDDFIARFNGYHNAYGDSINLQNLDFQKIRNNKGYWKTWRQKTIGSLLSNHLLKIDSIQNWKFTRTLASVPKISKMDSHMMAFLPVKVYTSRDTVRAEIELHYIALSHDRFEWIITDVHFPNNTSDDFTFQPYFLPLSPPKDYLPPNADGNGFLLLQRKIKDTRSILDFVSIKNVAFNEFESALQQAISVTFSPVYFKFDIPGIATFQVDVDFSIRQVALPH